MDLHLYLQEHETAVSLAKKIGVTPGFVSQWLNGLRQVPAERCMTIERATGGLVRCEDLRPDLEWSVLRNPCDCQEAA